MNSKFYITLKRIGFRSELYPNAIEDLTSAYNELVRFINDGNNQLNDKLILYSRGEYNDITEIQLTFEKHHKWLIESQEKSLTTNEPNATQIELEYFREIIIICDDARATLLENLATYKFELFIDEQWLQIFKRLLPFSRFTKKLIDVFKNDNVINLSEKEITSSRTKELKMSQIALIHSYKEDRITRDNCDEIANAYGFSSKTSGQKLYQQFNKYCRATDRKGDGGTKRKNKYKIELIESIIYLLPNDKQEKVKDEIKILKNILENQY